MVTHETYRAADGRWLSPEDVEKRGGALVECATGNTAIPGRVEKMSKTKKHVVDPSPIIANYGAYSVRWFMLSDSHPERDLPWPQSGNEEALRYVPRHCGPSLSTAPPAGRR